jgi:hypothetical protein
LNREIFDIKYHELEIVVLLIDVEGRAWTNLVWFFDLAIAKLQAVTVLC